METGWNPWKLTAIGMGLVVATALVTGLVVANWTGTEAERTRSATSAPAEVTQRAATSVPPQTSTVRPQRAASATPVPTPRQSTAPAAPAAAREPRTVAGVPTQAAVEACNRQATDEVGQRNKTGEVVKDALIGAVAGAAIGAAGGAIADGGKGAGKGAAIGGVVGAGAGSLYGLNENKKHDEGYREAYAACMRARGYRG